MPIYEKYAGGRLVERVLPEPGMFDDTRLGLLVLDRREAGEVDGWYLDGEYQQVRAALAEAAEGTVKEILAEVGEDRERAGAALVAELASAKPRATLVSRLRAIAADPADTIESEG